MLRDRWSALPDNVRAAVLVAAAGLLLVSMTTLVKIVGQRLHSFQIVFFRCLIGFLVVLTFHGVKGLRNLKTGRPLLHILRSVVGISAMACMFYSVTHMVLAAATAIMFSRPLFMILVAFLLLGERISWRHSAAIVLGFLGILLIARPGTSSFQPTALVAAAGALLAVFVVVIIKKLAATERTMVIMFYYTMWTTVLSLLPAVFVWKTPTVREMMFLLVIGCIGVTGQGLITKGFGLGAATVTVPFDYLRLVYATLFGVCLFGEFPDLLSISGAALIIIGNLYIINLQRGSKTQPSLAASRR